MSEQNQMAISPVTAGLTGAAVGGIGNYFLGVGAAPKKGYKDAKELLTLESDKFEKLKKEIDASDNNDAKIEFKKVEDGRKIVSSAGETLEKEQATARKEMNAAIEKDLEANLTGDAKTKFTDAVKTEKSELDAAQKTITDKAGELKTARADANSELAKKIGAFREAYDKAVRDILGKDLTDLEEQLSKETDAAKKADIEKQIKAKKDAVAKEALKKDTVANAQKAMRDEKAKIIKADDLKTNANNLKTKKEAYNKKLVDSADEALKDVTAKKDGTALEKLKADINNWKTKLAEKVDDVKAKNIEALMSDDGVDGVKLKDLDTGKFKKFLPKAKTWPIVIAAAALGLAGVALAYMVGPKNATPADVA